MERCLKVLILGSAGPECDREVSLFQLETAHLGPSKLGVSDTLTLRAAGYPRFIGVSQIQRQYTRASLVAQMVKNLAAMQET